MYEEIEKIMLGLSIKEQKEVALKIWQQFGEDAIALSISKRLPNKPNIKRTDFDCFLFSHDQVGE